MKAMFCRECADMRLLSHLARRTCSCGGAWGEYIGKRNATYGGKAIPLGFDTTTFLTAVHVQPAGGEVGVGFLAFVCPATCKTFKREAKGIKEAKDA